jgi:alpha-tubulin suppressor-like RCC1 family protein
MSGLPARPSRTLAAATALAGVAAGISCSFGSETDAGSTFDDSVPNRPLVSPKLTTSGGDVPALHTCGLRSDGRLFCWGGDAFGELGTGLPNTDAKTPRAVPLANVVDVAAGYEGTCAVDVSGAAWCWGDGRYGERGDGTTRTASVPVQVVGLPPVSAIASAQGVSCAVARQGTVWCWGGNLPGQSVAAFLGNGTMVQSLVPVQVLGIEDAVAISGASQHFCALRASGGVRCWGHDAAGQLGDGTTLDRVAPVDVVGIDDAVAITAGWSHTCALRSNGTARCWGDNRYGELGDGTTTASAVPVDVVGLPHVVSVAAGNGDTCAVLADGTARCWGWEGRLYPDDYGGQQLGAGGRVVYSVAKLTPSTTFELFNSTVTVPLANLTSITTGNFFGTSCALTRFGEAFCWGDDSYGEVGDGATDGPAVYQPVTIGMF